MSVVAEPSPIPLRASAPGGLPGASRWYLAAVVAAAVAAAVYTAVDTTSRSFNWATLLLLVVAACIAQSAAMHIRGNQVFHTGLAFTVAAALLLPAPAVVLLCLVQHAADWVRQRYPWYIQTFNIANYTLSGLAAYAVHRGVLRLLDGLSGGLPAACAAVAAALAFILLNHALLARMLILARSRSLAETRLFTFDNLLTDVVLAATGIVVALLVRDEPAAAPIATLPLLLIHRALAVPQLTDQAVRDSKTNLLNPRGLEEAVRKELERAERFDRPLSLLLIDVDDLRGINNRYGHLTGDSALRLVADSLRAEARDYDICARWGGDEFVVVLPETSAGQAELVCERICQRISRIPIQTDDGDLLQVTASAGSASRTPTSDLTTLMRDADRSMYSQKLANPQRSISGERIPR
jgi:diguanylate cyclase (GGDEF)-like protein